MKKVKFNIALFLFVLILVSCENNNFEYTVENGKATITNYTGDAENLTIPPQN